MQAALDFLHPAGDVVLARQAKSHRALDGGVFLLYPQGHPRLADVGELGGEVEEALFHGRDGDDAVAVAAGYLDVAPPLEAADEAHEDAVEVEGHQHHRRREQKALDVGEATTPARGKAGGVAGMPNEARGQGDRDEEVEQANQNEHGFSSAIAAAPARPACGHYNRRRFFANRESPPAPRPPRAP